MAVLTTSKQRWMVAVVAVAVCAWVAIAYTGYSKLGDAVHGGGKSFCQTAVADYKQSQHTADSGAGGTPAAEKLAAKDMKQLAGMAPAEIKADMQVEARSVDLASHNNESSVDAEALDAANEHVTTYLNQHCGGGVIDFSN